MTVDVAGFSPSLATKRNATRIDNRIRKAVNKIQTSFDELCSLIDEARRNEIHLALGFDSWTAYLADAVKLVPNGIEDRREVVALLAGEGMSNRAIGAIVGADEHTVRRDLKASGAEDVASNDTTGLDGKTYKRKPRPVEPEPEVIDAESYDGNDGISLPKPKLNHSTSLTTDMREALDNLIIDLHELNLVITDDRFSKVKHQLANKFTDQLSDITDQMANIVTAIVS